LTCNTQKLPSLRLAHAKFNVEIYYVRNIVDAVVINTLPFEILTIRIAEDEDSLFTDSNELYEEMKGKYVGDDLSQTEFDMLFSKLEFKYKDRRKEYVVCTNGSWEEVAEKWEEFSAYINDTFVEGDSEDLNEAKKAIGGQTEKLVESATDGGVEAWYEGRFVMNINNLDAKAGFDEIAENFNEYVPNTDVPTQSEFLSAVTSVDKAYDIAKIRTEMSSDYYSLYKETSDTGVKALVDKLVAFDNLLTDSFLPLDEFLEGTENLNQRQCPGKFK